MKIKILNMACGHCRLKIESELKSKGFTTIKFDMLNDTVEVEGENLTLEDAYRAIDKAGYMVDKTFRDKDSEIIFKILNLNSEDDISELKDFLNNENMNELAFDLKEQTLKVNKSDKEIEEIIDLIEVLGYEVKLVNGES